jgi:hypothetical protein
MLCAVDGAFVLARIAQRLIPSNVTLLNLAKRLWCGSAWQLEAFRRSYRPPGAAVSQKRANHREAQAAGGANAGEAVPQIMEANMLQLGNFTDLVPRLANGAERLTRV